MARSSKKERISKAAVQKSFSKAAKELSQILRDEEAIYKIPWFGLVGESGCEKGELLHASAIKPRQEAPSSYGLKGSWATHWWFFNDAVVVDFSELYFGEPLRDGSKKVGFFKRIFGKNNAIGEWREALDSLGFVRRRRPLDGLIVTLDARKLQVNTPEKINRLTRDASDFADQIHEAQYRLGIHFPVYIILTHCESIQGFEAFGRCLSEPVREQMLGWSSPHKIENHYQTEWVDEAIASLHEAVSMAQLQFLSGISNQNDRDSLYLFPKSLNEIREPLRIYLDLLFKGNSYRRPLPLRGIYLTGKIGPEKTNLEHPPPLPFNDIPVNEPVNVSPSFVKQLFSEKIFQEPGLAELDKDRNKKLDKKVRFARLSLLVTLIISLLLMTIQYFNTESKVDDFSHVLSILQKNTGDTRNSSTAKEGKDLIATIALFKLDSFESLLVPTSFIEGITDKTISATSSVFGAVVGDYFAGELETKADGILHPRYSVESDFHDLSEFRSKMDPFIVKEKTPKQWIKKKLAEAQRVEQLYSQFNHYQSHTPNDLSELYSYLSGTPASESIKEENEEVILHLKSNKGMASKVFNKISGWPSIDYGIYRKRARNKWKHESIGFYVKFFEKNPLKTILPKISNLIDGIEEEKGLAPYNDRFLEIINGVKDIESHISDQKFDWLIPQEMILGKNYDKLLAILNGPILNSQDEIENQEEVGREFSSEVELLFKNLRSFIWNVKSLRGEEFTLLDRQDGKIKIDPMLDSILSLFKEYQGLGFVFFTSEERKEFAESLNREAGTRVQWNDRLIKKVLSWHKSYDAYYNRIKTPTFIDRTLKIASTKELSERINQVMVEAQPLKIPTETLANSTWTAQKKEGLKKRIGNLFEQFDSILEVQMVLETVAPRLKQSNNQELFKVLKADALKLITQADQLLEDENLYLFDVKDDLWEGESPVGVSIFSARDLSDLVSRLTLQRNTIAGLANDFAGPLIEKIIPLGKPLVDDGIVQKWKKIIDIIKDYEKKVPGNSLEELERFVETDLNKLQLTSCQSKLKKHANPHNKNDFFMEKKYNIAFAIRNNCRKNLKTRTLKGYVELQSYFSNNLAGRFPFASPDVPAEVETRDIIAFYQKYDDKAEEFRALLSKKGAKPFEESSSDIFRFLSQVKKARPLFAALIDSEDENPDLILDANFDFRVNRDNEVNGNQIIQWWSIVGEERIGHRDNKQNAQWRTTDPSEICFRWANDGNFLPSGNQRAEHAQVNGRTICYAFTGRWALFRLLMTHAATPADRGRRSFLRPHTLRFETETSRSSSARRGTNYLFKDTRVYVRIALMLPGEKSAYQLPELPRRAPELPLEFLKKNKLQNTARGEW